MCSGFIQQFAFLLLLYPLCLKQSRCWLAVNQLFLLVSPQCALIHNLVLVLYSYGLQWFTFLVCYVKLILFLFTIYDTVYLSYYQFLPSGSVHWIWIFTSIHLSKYPSIYPTVRPPVHPSIHPSLLRLKPLYSCSKVRR